MKKCYLSPSIELVEFEIESSLLLTGSEVEKSSSSASVPSFGGSESAW